MSKKRKLQKHIENIARNERKKDASVCDRSNVRLSVPFNMCCKACSEQIPLGKRHYATKAVSCTENYLGVEVYVFEFKCPECRLPIRFKTDPKNGAYVCDYNCRKTDRDEEEMSVKILKNREIDESEKQKRESELLSIRRFLESSKSANIDKVKENLRRQLGK